MTKTNDRWRVIEGSIIHI